MRDEMPERDWSRVAAMIKQLQAIPALADRYATSTHASCLNEIQDFPPMDEATYIQAMNHLKKKDPPRDGSYLFYSSGTLGAAKLGLQPRGQHIREILDFWDIPLCRGTAFLDFSGGGKAWSMNHFFRELCLEAGLIYLHLGNIESTEELRTVWMPIILDADATVVSGNPTLLEFVASFLKDQKLELPSIKQVLWTAEPIKDYHEAVIRSVFTEAQLWACYGGTEPWVIGVQRPDMGRNEFDVLPYQLVEHRDNCILVSNLNSNAINTVLRYRISDRVEVLEKNPDGSVRRMAVRGRTDQRFFHDGNNLSPEVILKAVQQEPSVVDAQLILERCDQVVVGVEVRVRLSPAVAPADYDRISEMVLRLAYEADLQNTVLKKIMRVESMSPMILNSRTGKCPAVVYRDNQSRSDTGNTKIGIPAID